MTNPVHGVADTPAASPLVDAIDHVALAVQDADAAADWFCRRLGLVCINDELIHGDVNVRLVFLAVGPRSESATVQLVSPIGPGAVATYIRDHGEGLHHVCFKVGNIRQVLDDLGEPSTPTFIGGYGLPCAFLEQPTPCDTNIELVGEAAASPKKGRIE